MTIVEFLLARLDEWESDADSTHGSCSSEIGLACDCGLPNLIRADVAAKRRIIEWALVFAEDVDGEWGDGHTAAQIKEGQCTGHGSEAALSLLRLLAQPYADHPDFDPAWSVA